MKISILVLKKVVAVILFIVASLVLVNAANAIPRLTMPQPKIYLYSMPAPN